MSTPLERLGASLRSAHRVAFLTGAGISAESGIATFRDRQTGLWARYDAAELATPQAFERDPALVWGWYEWRRAQVRDARPNAGHLAIAAMATRLPQLTLITQNVDDLHERAGSTGVIHLHGELARSRCFDCGREPDGPPGHIDSPAPAPHASAPSAQEQGPPGPVEPPHCRHCGGYLRPGVVWFGERLPPEAWRCAEAAARRSEIFFCCGTSSVVQPAASLTDIAAAAGAITVQINPDETGIEHRVSVALRAKAGEVLPALLAAAWDARA